MQVTRDVIDMLRVDMTPYEIRTAVDTTYAAQIELATETPYPPADMTWEWA